MFSGIVEGLRSVVAIEPVADGIKLAIDLSDLAARVTVGTSVAVDGCCLTVERRSGATAWFHVAPETLRLTTLGLLTAGSLVNIERSLRVGDELGGHFVSGHIEGIGTIVEKNPGAAETRMTLAIPEALSELILHKGSIALDGVSLTVTAERMGRVSVMLIPHTLEITTLGRKGVGSAVNIETDILGRYVKRLLAGHLERSPEPPASGGGPSTRGGC